MSDSTQNPKQRRAILAILSLGLLLLYYVLASFPQGSDSRHGMNRGMIAGLSGAFGLGLAIVSVFRKERPAVFSWVALVLGFAPGFLLLLRQYIHR